MMVVLNLIVRTLLEDRGTVDLEQAGLVLVLFVVTHGWTSIAWRVVRNCIALSSCKRSIHNSLTPERGTFRRNPRHPRQGPSIWTLDVLSNSATTQKKEGTFLAHHIHSLIHRNHGRYGRYAWRYARHASQRAHR